MTTTYTRILNAALHVAASKGLAKLTRDAVAKRAKVAPGLVSYHNGGMAGLRESVIKEAIRTDALPIIAAAILMEHALATQLPEALRKRALLSAA